LDSNQKIKKFAVDMVFVLRPTLVDVMKDGGEQDAVMINHQLLAMENLKYILEFVVVTADAQMMIFVFVMKIGWERCVNIHILLSNALEFQMIMKKFVVDMDFVLNLIIVDAMKVGMEQDVVIANHQLCALENQ
jgi:hypothetical protein